MLGLGSGLVSVVQKYMRPIYLGVCIYINLRVKIWLLQKDENRQAITDEQFYFSTDLSATCKMQTRFLHGWQ